MPSYKTSGSATIRCNPGVRVRLNSVAFDSIVPASCSLSVLIRSDTGKKLGTASLSTGSNTISCGSTEINFFTVEVTGVGTASATPETTISPDYDFMEGEIVADIGDSQAPKTIINKSEWAGWLNGGMVYFPVGCSKNVKVWLKLYGPGDLIPSNEIASSDGIFGDGEVKFFNFNPKKFGKGESLVVMVSNADTEKAHKLFVYPEVTFLGAN